MRRSLYGTKKEGKKKKRKKVASLSPVSTLQTHTSLRSVFVTVGSSGPRSAQLDWEQGNPTALRVEAKGNILCIPTILLAN
jgi:hypothetical protein